MGAVKVKVCGLRRLEDIEYANSLKPEYIGFIFATGRKRTVSIEEAQILKKELSPEIKAVGVFLDQPISYMIEAVEKNCIDVIQLHGKEDNDYIQELRRELSKCCVDGKAADIKIIKAASIREKKDIDAAVLTTADYLLLDNHIPGSGESFDWSWLKDIKREFILAGGLAPNNVEDALATSPFCLDVSSGVETDGVKDFEKMKAFIEKVRF